MRTWRNSSTARPLGRMGEVPAGIQTGKKRSGTGSGRRFRGSDYVLSSDHNYIIVVARLREVKTTDRQSMPPESNP